jgi:hypothetical protein
MDYEQVLFYIVYKFSSYYLNGIHVIFIDNSLGPLATESLCIYMYVCIYIYIYISNAIEMYETHIHISW